MTEKSEHYSLEMPSARGGRWGKKNREKDTVTCLGPSLVIVNRKKEKPRNKCIPAKAGTNKRGGEKGKAGKKRGFIACLRNT